MAEVVREIIYRRREDGDGEYEPFLSIKPKVRRDGHKANFAIRLEDLWMYTPDKNPQFDRWMYHVVSKIYDMFNLGIITTQKMAEVATVIEDGIDDLLKAPPNPPAGSMEDAFRKATEQRQRQEAENVSIHMN